MASKHSFLDKCVCIYISPASCQSALLLAQLSSIGTYQCDELVEGGVVVKCAYIKYIMFILFVCPHGRKNHHFSVCLALHNFKPPCLGEAWACHK